MSTKIVTLRLPRSTYDQLSRAAAIAGLPVSAYIRGKIDRAELTATLEQLRHEIVEKRSDQGGCNSVPPMVVRELLYLTRAVAAHLSPQISHAVRKRLEAQQKG